MASAVSALLPFVPTYAVALPGCVVLLAQGRLLAALLFFALHFTAYYIGDTVILEVGEVQWPSRLGWWLGAGAAHTPPACSNSRIQPHPRLPACLPSLLCWPVFLPSQLTHRTLAPAGHPWRPPLHAVLGHPGRHLRL